MAYIKIETSVPRHHKFLAAGPEACWLWVAGTCYCMDGLTDGLIPRAALSHLGVLKPEKLALRLVAAGLWDEHPDGWIVHDFLDHNRTADYIRTVKQERRNAGAMGGAASWDARAKAKQSAEANSQQTVSTLPNLAVAVAVTEAVEERKQHTASRNYPADFVRFWSAYPKKTDKDKALSAWKKLNPGAEFVDVLLVALDSHKASDQWQRGVVPHAATWLNGRRWEDELQAARDVPARAANVPEWAREALAAKAKAGA